MIQLEDAAEMAEAITKRSSLEFNALTQTGIDSMASWDREQQATINAAVEEPEGAEEHHTPPPIMCPVSLSLIPRGSEVIIVGNHATEKDIYIGKKGIVKSVEERSYNRKYGYQILMENCLKVRHFTVDAVEEYTTVTSEGSGGGGEGGGSEAVPTSSRQTNKGKRKAPSQALPGRTPAIPARPNPTPICTCNDNNNTLSMAFFDDTQCQACKENVPTTQPVPVGRSASNTSNASNASHTSYTTDDEKMTAFMQMSAKVKEFKNDNDELKLKMKLLERQVAQLKKEKAAVCKKLKDGEKWFSSMKLAVEGNN